MRARLRGVTFLVVLLGAGAAWAQEARPPREALILAVERGPGAAKGQADAPLTVVEFSDFRCSFCQKFWRETLPRIEAEYVATGKVRFIYRHLVTLGPPSARAAEAAECAAEQGKFWAYHDVLFESAPSAAFTDATLKGYATDLGLDRASFGACLGSGRHAERILGESTAARYLGASGTPTFLIKGRLLIGAHPFETFKRALDAELARAGAGAGDAAAPGETPTRRSIPR